MAKELSKALQLGAWITASVFIVNYLLSFLKISVVEIFALGDISGATGITSTIGSKVITTLQKFITFDVASIVAIYISAFAIIFVGMWLKDNVRMLPSGKSSLTSITLALLYGTAVFYLLLVGFGMPAIGTIIGLLVYYAGIALVMSLAKGMVSKLA